MVVNYNDIINAIAKAEDVALYNARSRAIELSNGCKPSAADNEKAIEIESWIQILTRAAATIDEDTCLDDDIIWEIIQNINEQNREVDCDVSRTYSRHASSGGGSNVPYGYVERVLGLYVDNSNPRKPVIRIYVNPATISGDGTEENPYSAIGGGGGSGTVSNGTQYRIAYYAANGTTVSQGNAITGNRVLVSDANGVPASSSVTATVLAFLDATSSIQTQLNSKMTNPMTTGGDVIYGGGSGVPTRLPNGTAGQVLQSNGTTLAPSWAAPSGGATNLGNTPSPTQIALTSSTGTGTNLPLADATNAGLLKPDKFTVLENTSGTNTGNETAATIGAIVNGAAAATPNDTDLVATVESSVVKKITWTNVKAFLKTYFDAIYTTTAAVATQITTALSGYLTAATAAATYETIANVALKANIASPTFTGTVTTPAIIVSSETASRIAIFDASKNVKSADTATYPSLTELAYVKNLGSQAVGTSDTNTLTNKRITARTGTTTSLATPTINTDNVDFYSLTAQTVDITSFTTNLSGTPTEGQTLWIAITGTAARAITWGSSFEASTIALPTTTVTTNRLDVAFIWNSISSKWRCVGSV